MKKDILEVVDAYIDVEDKKRWVKLSSTVNSRALEILLLREILVELRKLNSERSESVVSEAGSQREA